MKTTFFNKKISTFKKYIFIGGETSSQDIVLNPFPNPISDINNL